MIRYFVILVGLMVIISPTSADFGFNVGDSFEYTLLQSKNNSIEGEVTFRGEEGSLKIPVGGVFAVSLISPERYYDYNFGTFVNISMSYNGQNIKLASGIDESEGFFIDMNFDEYSSQRTNRDNSQIDPDGASSYSKYNLIETDTEIGIQKETGSAAPIRSDREGSETHFKTISRYSKANGVLNYYFIESSYVVKQATPNAVNTVTLAGEFRLEYIRVGYTLPNTKLHFTIPLGTSWLVGLILVGIIRRNY